MNQSIPQQLTPFQHTIWDEKYRLKDESGNPLDLTIEDTWRRVARAVAQPEAEHLRPQVESEFYGILSDFQFLPAGRILAGAGTARTVTLQNCFVGGTIPDSLDGIYESLREAAITLKSGGGIGYDFSTIRPKGALVRGVGAPASGPVSFMENWNSMCGTIMGAGVRRGAMMATLRVDHPDILEFVCAKHTAGRMTNFNVSVMVTDEFMDAVEHNMEWSLIFDGQEHSRISARELWNAIMESTYKYAEPGVIFIDRMNTWNNLHYCETIAATNPCGEQPLPPYGACCLGSINITRLVDLKARSFHYNRLRQITQTAVRFLDNVVSVSKYPLQQQADEAHRKRRIGLGITGLADALALMGLKYGTQEALKVHSQIQYVLADSAYHASAMLAKEKGAFQLYNGEKFGRRILDRLGGHTLSEVDRYGLRNGTLISIAPTGTISLLAGNVSSGIEPIFALQTERTRKGLHGDVREVIKDWAAMHYEQINGLMPRSGEGPWVTAQDLNVDAHMGHLAIAQRYCCTAVSKTINLSESTIFDAFKEVYRKAYIHGAKGCTTYRPSGVRGAVLRPIEEPKPEGVTTQPLETLPVREAPIPPELVEQEFSQMEEKLVKQSPLVARPSALSGTTYKLRWPSEDSALYLTINNHQQDDGHIVPFEIFVVSKNPTHYAWISSLTRMISAIFRRGGDVGFVAEELMEVFDPRGGARIDRKLVPSLPALIGHTVQKHMEQLQQEFPAQAQEPLLEELSDSDDPCTDSECVLCTSDSSGEECPRCGQFAFVKSEGCGTCHHCGYSSC